MYSLYIVRCADGSLYTGIAVDVERRFQEHQCGPRGAKYLRGKGPLRLEFVQSIGDRSSASRAEYRVKKLDREGKEKLIAGRYSLTELLAEHPGNGAQVSGEVAG
ncbi:MAG: GIY-YIG nuclease family protein [Gammaproteobacteria bacterium]|nr:GIY-YIG nuclease family protein [Gammaproteobacteria bacterium]MDH3417583.1 GIY-YIG nuclease family protein [Gammaproteobacteria bacterium]